MMYKIIESGTLAGQRVVVEGAVGLAFNSRASQIEHSVTNGSSLRRRFFEAAVLPRCRAAEIDPVNRHTLRRNTANIMKNFLICKYFLQQFSVKSSHLLSVYMRLIKPDFSLRCGRVNALGAYIRANSSESLLFSRRPDFHVCGKTFFEECDLLDLYYRALGVVVPFNSALP